jgi:peptide-methionine (S)-S-oxide reductase
MKLWCAGLITLLLFLIGSLPASARVTETAVLGGGCFWCLEAALEVVEGVTDVVSGYAGGHVINPSYEAVCTGRTGHAEVVQVRFDPQRLSFAELLNVFFELHDPTTPNRQGPDIGTQYRSVIFTQGAHQALTARSVIRSLQGRWGAQRPVTTQVQPLSAFYVAEAYHQDYFRQNPDAPYCQRVIAPKVKRARDLQRGHVQRLSDKHQ